MDDGLKAGHRDSNGWMMEMGGKQAPGTAQLGYKAISCTRVFEGAFDYGALMRKLPAGQVSRMAAEHAKMPEMLSTAMQSGSGKFLDRCTHEVQTALATKMTLDGANDRVRCCQRLGRWTAHEDLQTMLEGRGVHNASRKYHNASEVQEEALTVQAETSASYTSSVADAANRSTHDANSANDGSQGQAGEEADASWQGGSNSGGNSDEDEEGDAAVDGLRGDLILGAACTAEGGRGGGDGVAEGGRGNNESKEKQLTWQLCYRLAVVQSLLWGDFSRPLNVSWCLETPLDVSLTRSFLS